jgi:hypothetical protein
MSIIGKLRSLNAAYPVYSIVYDLKYIIRGGFIWVVIIWLNLLLVRPSFKRKKEKKESSRISGGFK